MRSLLLELLLTMLDRRLVGEGEGDSCASVSTVRSDNEGRGLRLCVSVSDSVAFAFEACGGFSSPSSKTGTLLLALGGVVSKAFACAALNASRTGDGLRSLKLCAFHPYLDWIDELAFSPRMTGPFWREGRGSADALTGSSFTAIT